MQGQPRRFWGAGSQRAWSVGAERDGGRRSATREHRGGGTAFLERGGGARWRGWAARGGRRHRGARQESRRRKVGGAGGTERGGPQLAAEEGGGAMVRAGDFSER
jgi:hypothetical protein